MGGVVRKVGTRQLWRVSPRLGDGWGKDADGSPFGGTLVDGPRGGMRSDKSVSQSEGGIAGPSVSCRLGVD